MNSKLAKKLMLTVALLSAIGAASLARADDFGGPSVGPAFVAPEPTPGFSETPGSISTAALTLPEPAPGSFDAPSSAPEPTPSLSGDTIFSPNNSPSGIGLQPIASEDSLKDTLSDNGDLADGANVDAAPPVLERPPVRTEPSLADNAVTNALIAGGSTLFGKGDLGKTDINGNVSNAERAAGIAIINTIGKGLIDIKF